MARDVYSTLFVDVFAAEINAEYAVPEGYLAVVRDVATLCNGLADDTVMAVLNSATGAYVYFHSFSDENDYQHWEGRQVIPGGSNVQVVSYGVNAVSCRVTGYLLSIT